MAHTNSIAIHYEYNLAAVVFGKCYLNRRKWRTFHLQINQCLYFQQQNGVLNQNKLKMSNGALAQWNKIYQPFIQTQYLFVHLWFQSFLIRSVDNKETAPLKIKV